MGDLEIFGVAPAGAGVKRATDIVAALAPPDKKADPGTAMVPAKQSPPLSAAVKTVVPGAVGAVGGYLVGKRYRHPILGALLGHAVADGAYKMVRGATASAVACDVAVEGAGVAGALMWKKHPVVGYLTGVIAGVAGMIAFVPNSPQRIRYDRWKSK